MVAIHLSREIYMTWITSLNDTYDGKTLSIIPPIQVNDSDFKDVSKPFPNKRFVKCEVNGTVIVINTYYISDTLQESIRKFNIDLIETIKWLRDDRKAPSHNPKMFEDKCIVALENLRSEYLNKFPEVFI